MKIYPKKVLNWINNQDIPSGNFFDKFNPATGELIAKVSRSSLNDANNALKAAQKANLLWKDTQIIKRAQILREATKIMEVKSDEVAKIVALETGKSYKDALGEVGAAVELGYFISGEGRRFYGRTTTSAVSNRFAYTIRQPVGIAVLIIAANTPIANVAWKAYPALLCGNTAVMKPSEDTPYTANWFAKALKEAGLPDGVFNVVHGFGEEAGSPLVENPLVDLISFTGSVPVGKYIQEAAAKRLAKVCLELGGKNALIVCEDAELEKAAQDGVLSAFSNAGQRCSSGSRIIIFNSVYEKFKKIFLEKTKRLKIGATDQDDFGPVINASQLENMLQAIEKAANADKATLLYGGKKLIGAKYQKGYFLQPTILENVSTNASISQDELFGPITCLYRVKDFNQALKLANNSNFGLTAAIHTKNLHRAQMFIEKIETGVVSVNGPTYGSEPHMPFGGIKNSGNGFREPGTEALDVYSEWKTVYIKHFPELV